MQGTFPESSSYFKAAFGIYIVRNIENCLWNRYANLCR
jgi:hypothetical protein